MAALALTSVAVTVAVYVVWVSKSGAVTKDKTPAEVISSSVPEIVNVTDCKSDAVTVPIAV